MPLFKPHLKDLPSDYETLVVKDMRRLLRAIQHIVKEWTSKEITEENIRIHDYVYNPSTGWHEQIITLDGNGLNEFGVIGFLSEPL